MLFFFNENIIMIIYSWKSNMYNGSGDSRTSGGKLGGGLTGKPFSLAGVGRFFFMT